MTLAAEPMQAPATSTPSCCTRESLIKIPYPDPPTLHLPYLTESEIRSRRSSRQPSRSSSPAPSTILQSDLSNLARNTQIDVRLLAEIMVHLAQIPTDREISAPLVNGLEKVKFEDADEDTLTASVYGSRYAAEDLPKFEMPEREMPKEVAYRMIKDDLTLDGTPTLNLASFVTTYMEDEAEKLMTECFSKNFIDYEEYPVSADIQNRCVSMIAKLFNIPTSDENSNAMGTSTIGSSEAIMLAVLAMKKLWQNKRKAEGKPFDRPNIIMNSAVQVCWEKAARYFDVEERYVYCTAERYVIDPKQAVDLIDENTIGICAILGTTYTGEYEDVKAINDLLIQRNIDVPIHVDAASGGFVAPFINPGLLWDFRLEKVVSINVSGHKYGLVYPGVGWVVWRDPKFLPKELIFNINYLGADQASFTLNFSRGASQIIGQYYQLIRLGKHGYRSIMLNLTRTADYLAANLEQLGFIVMSQKGGRGLPLVACRLDPSKEKAYDEFAIAHQLRERGWVVPAYTMAPHCDQLKLMRVVVREDFTRSRCDALIADFKLACQTLDSMDDKKIEEHKEHFKHMRRHATRTGRHHRMNSHFSDETHSLQGKTGKTHAIC
ncbi:glutamate decarboxylase [Lepidopterella palustris CBS 459.81]|uniref:Glutamate decarboxylase n=1 Tax=Lepidopterella palustris CBS 459.81 TaxID=1314670 RepID=A0A8E2JBN0_9PEZI|nr:glutamate decarboxylase [Lepidopterella palustris CBS 459.81]